MITTSNFGKNAKHPDAVAISQGVPRFYRGKRYMPLAPPRWLLKAKDPELFDREYRKQLDSLDAKQVAGTSAPMPSFCVGSRSTCAATGDWWRNGWRKNSGLSCPSLGMSEQNHCPSISSHRSGIQSPP